MTELREHYVAGRILIEAERMADPRFDALGIYLTGGEVEMLRNVVHYLARRSTWVGAYADGYYTMPSDLIWDDILALVAGLECKLMGNENTLWGYNDVWNESLALTQTGDGTAVVIHDPVGDGEVLILQGLSWLNQVGQRGTMQFQVRKGSTHLILANGPSQPQYVPLMWTGRVVLLKGDYVVVKQSDALGDDTYVGAAWGVKMVVPG